MFIFEIRGLGLGALDVDWQESVSVALDPIAAPDCQASYAARLWRDDSAGGRN